MRLILTLLLTGVFNGLPGALPAGKTKPVHIDLDYAEFAYNDNQVYLEIYYATGEDQLTYTEREGRFEGGLLLRVEVPATQGDSLLIDRVWRTPHTAEPEKLNPDRKVVGLIGLVLPAGAYNLQITYFDELDRSRVDSITLNLPARNFSPGKPAISDIELASSIQKAEPDPGNIFYKNTYSIMPNPSKLFGLGKPVLFYYAECYGLLAYSETGHYQFRVDVIDQAKRQVYHKSYTREPNTSRVEVGTVNVSAMPSGRYELIVSLVDSSTGLSVTSEKPFFVYNPSLTADTNTGGVVSPYVDILFADRSEEHLDEEFAMARYVANNKEIKQFKRLSGAAAKRNFLYDFWKRRDQNQGTLVLAYREKYLRWVDLANEKYTSGPTAGWQTDRGRVLILYGNPEEIEFHPNEIEARPYEIWYYEYLQGGVYFVFLDRTGFLDYYLIQSTARNEISNLNWRSRLNPGQ